MKTPAALENLLHARTGPMTTELVQHPAAFDLGLGRVPARLAPVATTNTVCGFCSTGCSLRVHLDAEGQAINLSADPDYPVNLGMACPKGWEALTPLAARRNNPEYVAKMGEKIMSQMGGAGAAGAAGLGAGAAGGAGGFGGAKRGLF
jgi:hypothetical protein